MIDLDLVELRCRLRGWECQRRDWLVPEVHIATPDGGVWLTADGLSEGVPMYGHDGDGILRLAAPQAHCLHADRHVAALTAPRWTLDRLLSDPPEGWTYDARHERLMWVGDPCQSGEPCLSVTWEHGGKWMGWEWHFDIATDCYSERLPAFARQARAAAELALILAEVEA